MGGEGGFLDKLRQMMMGSRPPPAPPQAMPEGKPWEDPSLAPPMHEMPGGQMMPGAQHPGPMPSPSPSPMPQDDIGMQIQRLMKQRELASKFAPEQAWNK